MDITSELRGRTICVTGGAGFLGRAVCARLRAIGVDNVVVPRSHDYDLTCPRQVERLFRDTRPAIIIHLAAEVGGIGANQRQPGRYFYANMAMGLNLIESCRRHSVSKFVQIGTVCAYPKHCPTPFREEDLWSGFPEETNAPYGVAKRSLAVMLDAYRKQYGLCGLYLLPTNLYGPGDNFEPETSHVIPAMVRKFTDAVEHGRRSVTCWGSGRSTRDFLYVDDAATAIVEATAGYDETQPLNLGTGREISMSDLAGLIARCCDFEGEISWDSTRPDGQPRRCLDVRRAQSLLDWRPRVELEDGLRRTIDWWRTHRPGQPATAAIQGTGPIKT